MVILLLEIRMAIMITLSGVSINIMMIIEFMVMVKKLMLQMFRELMNSHVMKQEVL